MMLETIAGKASEGCHGCKSEQVAVHCQVCGIKTCATEKGYEFCYECSEMETCTHLQPFIVDDRYPYHRGVYKNFEIIQKGGVTQWLDLQNLRWQCPNCGSPFSWWDETCPQCAKPVEKYKADLQ
jgi:hypothetical protein